MGKSREAFEVIALGTVDEAVDLSPLSFVPVEEFRDLIGAIEDIAGQGSGIALVAMVVRRAPQPRHEFTVFPNVFENFGDQVVTVGVR